MDIQELAGQINEQHRETQARLIKLDEEVGTLKQNQGIIQSRLGETVMTKLEHREAAEKCRNQVYCEIRKVGRLNKIISSIAIPVAAVIGWLTAKFGNGG